MKYVLPGRLPPIAVKLNGETAKTNPSRGLYSIELEMAMRKAPSHDKGEANFQAPGEPFGGCAEYSSSTNLTPNRKKSASYQKQMSRG